MHAWPVGPVVEYSGTSFVFLAPVIGLAQTVMARGSLLKTRSRRFGTCLVAAIIPILIGPFIARVQVITPLVTGVV